MSQPTKEQWTEIQGQLNSQFTTTYLDCDGYLISARMVRSKNKLVIQVYVDGYIHGKWIRSVKTIDEFAEVPKRFYRHARKNIWPRKLVKDMEKLLGKRRCKEEGYYGERYTSFPWFNSAETFISHLKKHNQSIELLDHTTYQQRLTAKQAQEQTA